MTTRRSSSSRRSSSPRRTTSSRSARSTRSTRSQRSTTSASPRRRRQSRPATTFGAAVGTVVVAFVLHAPWAVRIALIVLVLLGLVGYLVWTRRR